MEPTYCSALFFAIILGKTNPMQLSLRKCTLTDLDDLLEMSKTTFAEAFEKDNNPEDFKAYLQEAFHPRKLAKELSNIYTHFYFVNSSSKRVAYMKLNVASAQTDVHHPRAMEIERIYVAREYQGKQIGAWMLNEIKSIAKKFHKEFIWLGVWEHNPKAIAFYKRHGFVKFGEHPYYIGKDKQTDWLLRLDLK